MSETDMMFLRNPVVSTLLIFVMLSLGVYIVMGIININRQLRKGIQKRNDRAAEEVLLRKSKKR
ncbi:MAG: hypothetical protein WCS86_00355 [Candidatus Paceibacterota bacterium]|jgi:hypothetical protein